MLLSLEFPFPSKGHLRWLVLVEEVPARESIKTTMAPPLLPGWYQKWISTGRPDLQLSISQIISQIASQLLTTMLQSHGGSADQSRFLPKNLGTGAPKCKKTSPSHLIFWFILPTDLFSNATSSDQSGSWLASTSCTEPNPGPVHHMQTQHGANFYHIPEKESPHFPIPFGLAHDFLVREKSIKKRWILTTGEKTQSFRNSK